MSGSAGNVLIIDSATKLGAEARDAVVVCGSHGGAYPAALAARAGVRAIVLNDAGVGLDGAGIGGLGLLQEAGIPAATVGHEPTTIGSGEAVMGDGAISHANALADQLGCRTGMRVPDAVAALREAPPASARDAAAPDEARHLLDAGPPPTWALDSASLAGAQDAGAILFIGSHAQLLGGDAAAALRAEARGAVFNDAGVGGEALRDGRLAALDERRIAAATVGTGSARIGDGRSTYFDGVVSAVNRHAADLGATCGMPASAFAELLRGQPTKGRDR